MKKVLLVWFVYLKEKQKLMSNFSSLTSKKLLQILKKFGFEIDHITGSHYILYHCETNKRITLPFHIKDLLKGTAFSILKMAGISKKDLENF